MILYLDSSVVLRTLLKQPGRLANELRPQRSMSSTLLQVECWRTLDRFRVAAALAPEALVEYSLFLRLRLQELERIPVTTAILQRASLPLPVPLGTLDAIHLASALLWQEAAGHAITMATHDRQLGLAARASGLDVVGVAL
ncbi:MAG TPA: type II toxin-antitoxin system VapC family toxin [Terriglobales bacterium]|nr:type II toxin-antitoxin system VapC family toxin [Terriglobales bacterium]